MSEGLSLHRDLYEHVDRLLRVPLRHLLAGARHEGLTPGQVAADLSWLVGLDVSPTAVESWFERDA